MKSLYHNTKSCVKCNNKLTEYFQCTYGTRQSCVTIPKIFSLHVKDLNKYLKLNCAEGLYISEVSSLYALIYADDVSSFADTVNRLQRQIDSKLFHFQIPRRLIYPKLSWSLTVEKLYLQAVKASNIILRYQKKKLVL